MSTPEPNFNNPPFMPTDNTNSQPVSNPEPVQQVQEQPVSNPEPVQQVQEQPVSNPEPVQQVQEQPVQQVQEQSVTDAAADQLLQPNTQATTPLDTNTFTPMVESNQIIGQISPANFDNFLKVLKALISDKSAADNVVIRQSLVRQSTPDCIIESDLSNVLDYNGKKLDLDIINPSKYVGLFGQFRNQNNIFIIDDSTNSRFIITNGEIKLFLPKQEDNSNMQVQNFDFTNYKTICNTSIDKETRKVIKNISKNQDYVEFLIQNNIFKGLHIPDTAIYLFQKYQSDPDAAKLDETNADLVLRSSNFLPVDADNYNLLITQLQDGKYVCVTNCTIGGQIDVQISEQCEVTTGGNILI